MEIMPVEIVKWLPWLAVACVVAIIMVAALLVRESKGRRRRGLKPYRRMKTETLWIQYVGVVIAIPFIVALIIWGLSR